MARAAADAYLDDRLDALVAARRVPRVPGLTREERQLLGVLGQLLAQRVEAFSS